jgi:phosphate transport system substrate-binding protein
MHMPARLPLAVAAVLLVACGARETSATTDTASARAAEATRVDLTGAGATFPYPLYARWFNEYSQRSNVRINYHSVGSGEGIRRLLDGAVDFGATESPMSEEELARAPAPIIHIPTILGAVAITYNLPALKRPLKVSGDVLADIFLGRITRWNDKRLVALNPGEALPAGHVTVVHRTDASGTTFIFADYLSTVSDRWRSGPGKGRQLEWPTGVGGAGNEGIAAQVKQTVGAIGYVEVVYARQNRLPVAHVRNRAGRFISPMPFEVAAAAAGNPSAADHGFDGQRSLVDAPGNQAYPIASFTWILLSPDRLGPAKLRQLRSFLRWALVDGSSIASSMGYVALPSVAATRVIGLLDTLSSPDRRP